MGKKLTEYQKLVRTLKMWSKRKSPIMKRWAKKHGVKCVNIKLSTKPMGDLIGFPCIMASHGMGKSFILDEKAPRKRK